MNPEKGPKENPYKVIIDRADGILAAGRLDKQTVKKEIEIMLSEIGVPFTRVEVEEDRDRADDRQVCYAMVFVPRSWPDGPGKEGEDEYQIPCRLPETSYESTEKDY
jgi:hypothetical protein